MGKRSRKRRADPRKVAQKKANKDKMARKAANSDLNPFNRITRKTFRNAVMGQQVKGNVKRPSHTIQQGIKKRQKSLLREFNAIENNKLNQFRDKRYQAVIEKRLDSKQSGTNAKSEKTINKDKKRIETMMNRINTRRQLKSFNQKKQMFNIDDEPETLLTHLGKPITSESLKKQAAGSLLDGDDELSYVGLDNARITRMIERGMSYDDVRREAGLPGRHETKTKPQLKQEDILRSRYKKCLDQIQTQQLESATHDLDAKFNQIASIMLRNDGKPANAPTDEDDIGRQFAALFDDNSALSRAGTKKKKKKGSKETLQRLQQMREEREYNETLMLLERDMKASVTDKQMSQFDRCAQVLEQLEVQEKRRKRRNLGLPEDSDDEDETGENDEMDENDDEMGVESDDIGLARLEQEFERAEMGTISDDEDGMQLNENDANDTNDVKEGMDEAKGGIDEVMGENENEADRGKEEESEEGPAWEKILDEMSDDENGMTMRKGGKRSEDVTTDGFGEDAVIEMKYMPVERPGRLTSKKMKVDPDLVDFVDDDGSDDDAGNAGNAGNVSDGSESVEFNAEQIGDAHVLDLIEAENEMQREAEEKKKQQRVHDSTADWDSQSNLIPSRRSTKSTNFSKASKAFESKSASDAAQSVSLSDLKLSGRDDLVGEDLDDVSFLLDVPSSIEELELLVNKRTPEQQISILKRIRSRNHAKLSKNNESKIVDLYNLLLERFRRLCCVYTPTTRRDAGREALEEDVLFFKNIDVITRALFALSHDVPEHAYQCHKTKLSNIAVHLHNFYNLKSNQQFSAQGSGEGASSSKGSEMSHMPSGYALLYLKLLAQIFPKGDKRNNMVAGVLLILCKCVTEIPMLGGRDMVCYLFALTMILEIVEPDQRYVPEVVHGLINLLEGGFYSSDQLKKSSFDLLRETKDLYFTLKPGANIWHDNTEMAATIGKNDKQRKSLESRLDNCNLGLPLRWLFLDSNGCNVVFNDVLFKMQTLHTTLKLVMKCSQLWSRFLAYSEVFAPVLKTLRQNEERILSVCEVSPDNEKCLQLSRLYFKLVSNLSSNIMTQSLTRQPLHMVKRAIPIQMLEPEFDPDLKPSFLRYKVRNEKALMKKQQRLLKKARKRQIKGAMREVAKDTQFIFNEKRQLRIERDAKRHAKWVKEYTNLVKQARDANAFQMVGKKQKKKLMNAGIIKGYKK